jgi:hypothetical protein
MPKVGGLLALVVVGVAVLACAGSPPPARDNELPPVASRAALLSIDAQLEEITGEFEALAKAAPWKGRGYFDAGENDSIEHLLFQYVSARDALHGLDHWDAKKQGAASHLVAFAAGIAILDFDGRFVAAFVADEVATAKLNESFYRSEIPRETFEKLRLEATDRDRIEEVERGFAAFAASLDEPSSPLARAVALDSGWVPVVEETRRRADAVDDRLALLTDHESRVLASQRNALGHSHAADYVHRVGNEFDVWIAASRALLFKSVSRIKSPTAHLIEFSADQKRAIRGAMQPGDLLFSYTAGYTSDVFIPGAFKHAMVWVGTPEERRAAGLLPGSADDLPLERQAAFRQALDRGSLESGESADLVEAVAEGVKFSHLDTILDTHINRLAVLRPRLEAEDRRVALSGVFQYLGDGYDFRFDFTNSQRQVCTELVYRAYDARGPITFELTERMGRQTLSADDIVAAALVPDAVAYEVVLYADEDPAGNKHRARVLFGAAARTEVAELMAAEGEGAP